MTFDLASSDTKFYENYVYYSQTQQEFDHITEKDISEKEFSELYQLKKLLILKT